MAFEKERRINYAVMAAGLISAAVGLLIYFLIHKNAGVALLLIGVALLVITWSISGAFYRMKMMELLSGNNKKR